MKKQFITEATRLQKLAGIINESKINENQERMGIFDDIDDDLENEIDPIGYLDDIIKYCEEQKQFYSEEDELNENKGEFNISNHKEEALSILNQFVDEFRDQFEFIPDLNNYNIDDSDNSLNVDELGSVFLIPNGSSLPNNIKQYIGSSKNGEVNDNGSVWKKYPKDGYYYIAMS